MSIIFIDSDILLDVILDRAAFYDASAQILFLSEKPDFYCCTAVHTLLNVHYVTKRHLGAEAAINAIKVLVERLQIITENAEIVKQAINSEFKDFEDGVQYYAAKSVNADVIITRNIKDYKESTIPVLTAEQFLRTL